MSNATTTTATQQRGSTSPAETGTQTGPTTMDHLEERFNRFRNQNTFWHANKEGRMDEFDAGYEAAVEKVRNDLLGIKVPCVVNGEEITTGEWVERTSPADDRLVVCAYPTTTKQTAIKALEAAHAAEKSWAQTPWQERAAMLEKAAELYVRDFYELCAIMTFESGKTRYEASIDVDEAIDFLRFYAFTMREMNGFDMEMGQPVPNERCRSTMKPYGTFTVICPFNFPVAITTGMTAAALVTGNTAVMKPATKGVLAGWKCHQLLKEAGIPANALQFIVGPDENVATTLSDNELIDGIVFTGSKHIGFKVQQKMAERDPGLPVITEMGGKNSIIVTNHADLDKAVEGVYRSSFGFQGQKCSASSRVFVEKMIMDDFLDRLKQRMQGTVVDQPWKKEAFMGPIIEKAKYDWYQEWVNKVKEAGGRIIYGGETITEGELSHGYYVQPTIATNIHAQHEIFSTELFMPITTVLGYDGLDEAIHLANNVQYGLTAGIFTEDDDEANHFFENIESGVTYRNRRAGGSTAAVVNGQSFVGWKHSGNSGIGAGGRYYLLQFMRERSRTIAMDE